MKITLEIESLNMSTLSALAKLMIANIKTCKDAEKKKAMFESLDQIYLDFSKEQNAKGLYKYLLSEQGWLCQRINNLARVNKNYNKVLEDNIIDNLAYIAKRFIDEELYVEAMLASYIHVLSGAASYYYYDYDGMHGENINVILNKIGLDYKTRLINGIKEKFKERCNPDTIERLFSYKNAENQILPILMNIFVYRDEHDADSFTNFLFNSIDNRYSTIVDKLLEQLKGIRYPSANEKAKFVYKNIPCVGDLSLTEVASEFCVDYTIIKGDLSSTKIKGTLFFYNADDNAKIMKFNSYRAAGSYSKSILNIIHSYARVNNTGNFYFYCSDNEIIPYKELVDKSLIEEYTFEQLLDIVEFSFFGGSGKNINSEFVLNYLTLIFHLKNKYGNEVAEYENRFSDNFATTFKRVFNKKKDKEVLMYLMAFLHKNYVSISSNVVTIVEDMEKSIISKIIKEKEYKKYIVASELK